MELVLTLAEVAGSRDKKDLESYVTHLQAQIELQKTKGFPGVWFDNAEGGAWVSDVTIVKE